MAYVGQVGTIQVGGITLSLTNLKILHTGFSTNQQSVFYDASIGATRGVYQVASGKTFQLYAFSTDQISASGNTIGTTLLYCDNNIGIDSTTTPTNPVGLITAISTGSKGDYITSSFQLGTDIKQGVLGGSAPASKFIYAANQQSLITIYGYEV